MLKGKDGWRQRFHLMPPEGWLNDPNGLCQFQGIYHVFFQYSPNEPGPDGRKARTWGHYAGPDLLHLEFCGVPFWPVDPVDHDGCYSGSALVQDDEVLLYYTGNVKQPGDHDYTYSGREANEILVKTDGKTFGAKQTVLVNSDYPADCTCHVRDPKVWKEGDAFYMVLGARVEGSGRDVQTDYGEALFYRSGDGVSWKLMKTLTTPERFGYMWECPDYFEIDGHKILGICPQGLEPEKYRYQNIYQSGYWLVDGELEGEQSLHDFTEWDYGFDFYAPQTFVDEAGRRLLIGWVGMPDEPYKNPTAKLPEKSWENCLTVPRELTWEDGRILQNPVPELEALRYDETQIYPDQEMILPDGAGDFEISFMEESEEEKWEISIGDGLTLIYDEGEFRMELTEAAGCGRTVRRRQIPSIDFLRILVDCSVAEIYLNDGETVFTTRFYPDYEGERQDLCVSFRCGSAAITGWKMKCTETNTELI
uniref:glycoside hydrolase family 32 protein n=1 Tax=Eubacterium cellulosolvens TaxID=29322 RepID=UPI00068726D9|nr:glycoside hydrolase family 32 protein [[Eubacterium] cellulosolvens]